MDIILAAANASSRHLQEYGTIIAGIGAILLIVAGAVGLGAVRRDGNRETERYLLIASGLLLGIGFLVELLGLHHV